MVSFIVKNDPLFNSEEAENFLKAYEKKIIYVFDDGQIKGVAFYLKVDDETLAEIEKGDMDLSQPEKIEICYRQNGPHVHFFRCIASGYSVIKKGLRCLTEKENPETISWITPRMNFVKMKRLSHV